MINKVILIGNIGADAEIRSFEGGARKATFTLATSDGYYDKKNNNQWVEQTDWHSIEIWNPSDHLVANLFKGTKLYIEGKNKCNTYDGTDGQKKYFYHVKASTVRVLGSNGASQQNTTGEHPGMAGSFPDSSSGDGSDDLPF